MECPDCKDEKFKLIRNSTTGEHCDVRCACNETLPLKMVYQPEKSGCGVAAVAIVVQRSYWEVRQYMDLPHDFVNNGMYDDQLIELLDLFGWAVQNRRERIGRLNGTLRTPWPPEPFAQYHICTVKNLADNGYHYVVLLDDGRVMDPTWGVVEGLYRYPQVLGVIGVFPVATPVEPLPMVGGFFKKKDAP